MEITPPQNFPPISADNSGQAGPTPGPASPEIKPFAALIIIILLALTSGAVLAWKTPYLDNYLPSTVKDLLGKENAGEKDAESSEIDSWEIYRNDYYGVSFRYLGTYTLEESVGEVSNSRNITLSDQVRRGKPIFVLNLYDNYPITAGFGCDRDLFYSLELDLDKLKISSVEAGDECFDGPDPLRFQIQSYLFTHEDLVKSLGTEFSYDRSGPDYEQEFLDILKTFKFDRNIFR